MKINLLINLKNQIVLFLIIFKIKRKYIENSSNNYFCLFSSLFLFYFYSQLWDYITNELCFMSSRTTACRSSVKIFLENERNCKSASDIKFALVSPTCCVLGISVILTQYELLKREQIRKEHRRGYGTFFARLCVRET